MTNRAKSHRVLVSGASRGLGKELALAFGREGHAVLVHYHENAMAALEVVQRIAKLGGTGFAAPADIADASDVERLLDQARRRWGGLDIVVHNAGILREGLIVAQADADWDGVIRTNLTGAYRVIREAAKIMEPAGGGHILTLASRAGLCGAAGLGAYSAAKAGLIGLSKASAQELAPFNIRVNCVLPGYLPTDLGRRASAEAVERMRSDNVLGRFSDPTEVSRVIYALALTESVSGQIFQLDSRIAWLS